MVRCIFLELKYEKRKGGEVRKRHYSRPPSRAKYPGVLPEENRELLKGFKKARSAVYGEITE